MKLFRFKVIFAALLFCMPLLFPSCNSDDDDQYKWNGPKDEEAGANPIVDSSNIIIPNVLFSSTDNTPKIQIDLTGIQHPTTKEWIKLFGTQNPKQNVWVEVDGVAKGILVSNKVDDPTRTVLVDLVFSIDNSLSMIEEADALASSVLDWATKLSQQNISIRFGCVGYGFDYDDHPNGGINMTDLQGIHDFFNRPGKTGVERTTGFEGPDAAELLAASENYKKAHDECGAEAIRFADENYTFRSYANRVYVNFTDEPNQPKGYPGISVEFFKNQQNWNTAQGTIHTVFSASPNWTATATREYPWKMSEYTGGTIKYVASNFSNASLETLPITGAMENSYIIEFLNKSTITNGMHTVKITIRSDDGTIQGEKVFENVSF